VKSKYSGVFFILRFTWRERERERERERDPCESLIEIFQFHCGFVLDHSGSESYFKKIIYIYIYIYI
jgi:hypothetical protein